MESGMEVGKIDAAAAQPPPYSYPNDQVTSTQPANDQQQVYVQGNGITPQVMTVLTSPPNGTVLNCGANGAVVMGNGDVHFTQTRELLSDQNSNWSR